MNKNSILKLRPLGGLGSIGGNMMEVRTNSSHFLIDSGILFPNNDCFGVNYFIPDLSQIKEPASIIITHGHEDHIGAIYHIIKKFPKITIWAPPFATELIKSKLKESDLPANIKIYRENSVIELAGLEIHPIKVNHSIPDTYALLAIDKKYNYCFLFASDFKNFPKTEQLKKLTKKIPYRLLLADSTNILTKEKTGSEESVEKSLTKHINSCKGRIFATMFSSNIDRIRTFITIAKNKKMKIGLIGRSINSYVKKAVELKLISANIKFIDKDSINPEDDNILVILSGCQGDFRSALRRVAYGDDKVLIPRESDTFIFSSKAIPGNEKQIGAIKNVISKAGCTIITESEGVHVSGHPGQKDLKDLYEVFNPTDLIPVHGESFFLKEQIKFAKKVIPNTVTHLLYNNSTFELNSRLKQRIGHSNDYRMIAIHGKQLPILKETISTRRKCANSGIVFITKTKKHTNFTFLGLPDLPAEIYKQVEDNVNRNSDIDELKIVVRRTLNRYLGYKPVVVIHSD